LLIIIVVIVGPPIIYAIGYGDLSDLLKGGFGLGSCAEPRNRWDEFTQEDFEKNVKAGYSSWQSLKPSRRVGEDPYGPESAAMASRTPEQKLQYQDSRSFFAGSLMSDGPSKALKAENNWYVGLAGEWDVAFIQTDSQGQEKITAGEWIFAWINGGDALEDVLAIPFRWLKPEKDQVSIIMTSVRHFNPTKGLWEGFHIQSGQMYYFEANRGQNQLMESYRLENGPIMVWVFENVQRESFQVAISQSNDNGGTFQQFGRIWAKKRAITIE
jgi:hypothetical protein